MAGSRCCERQENGHKGAMELLLEKGAELESEDKHNGRTPLSCAAGRGHEALVQLLLDNVLLSQAYFTPRQASLLGMLPLKASGSYRH